MHSYTPYCIQATRDIVNSHLQPADSPSPPSTPTCTQGEATAAELTNERRPDVLSAILSDPTLGVDGRNDGGSLQHAQAEVRFPVPSKPRQVPPAPPQQGER